MRSWNILVLCFLTAAVYLASKSLTVAAASPAQFHLLGRRHMRDLRIPQSSQVDADQKFKVPPKEKAMYTIQSDLLQNESAINEKELVYHTDYHGVTTHPNPNPKHPKP
ncbi:putative Transmembrane protein [Heracleum sosnowskyi]|uniref:Transmembrane protein n=1 Tax=Heracleum sosnowskyi TaxID=360622 RepID=A0AAD8INT1_9APIA|nr:putative Transmembrane protein [Heracleum sosnowskyi]